MVRRPEQPEPFLRGCAWPAGSDVPYPRCDPGPAGLRLPADTRAAAAIPAGVRLEFTGAPEVVEIAYHTRTRELGHRGAGAGVSFALYRGDQPVAEAPASLGEGVVRLPAGRPPEPGIVYLPEGMQPLVLGVPGVGSEIAPAPRNPRWLCYGDSIAEGWLASGPARAWPHVAARAHRLDVVNLGYAGAARGEIASAEELAALPAELISISHGTNCWTRTPHSAAAFREGLRAFLDVVRQGHPATPVVAVSPLWRGDAEAQQEGGEEGRTTHRFPAWQGVGWGAKFPEKRGRAASPRGRGGSDLRGARDLPDSDRVGERAHRSDVLEARGAVRASRPEAGASTRGRVQ